MESAASPTLVGAFITAFLSLIGVVVWALRQQLSSSQKLIDVTMPAQQAAYVLQLDKLAVLFKEESGLSRAQFRDESLATRTLFRDESASDRALFHQELLSEREHNQEQLESLQKTFLEAHKEVVGWVKTQSEMLAANQRVLEQHTQILDRHTQLLEVIRQGLPARRAHLPLPPPAPLTPQPRTSP